MNYDSAASSPPSSTRRWRPPTGRASTSARRRARRAASCAGCGIGDYLEVTAPPAKEMGGIRFEADGNVTMLSGTLDYGQGHCDALRPGAEREARHSVRAHQAAAGRFATSSSVGGGTGGSKSSWSAAGLRRSGRQGDRARAGRSPAHVLEASAADIEFARGRFTIAGTDRGIGIMELADKLRGGHDAARRACRSSLDVSHISENRPSRSPTAATSPRSRSIRDTGQIEVVRYTMVNDFGTVINPMLVEGQAHGGVVQGIGQALMERTVYTSRASRSTGSLHGLRPAARRRRAGLRHRAPLGAVPRPTCWASRAAARRAAPARCPR